MSSLISHVKKKIYNSWVLRVDLNKFSIKDEDSEENHEEEVFKDVYVMLGFRNGIEKGRFKEIRNQKDYFIFLDAFDEIPAEHKSKALKLISFLREKTEARIMITTRVHHQQELEEKLNAFSSQLVPFDNLSQVNCLEKLWKWKLKFPNGEGTLMKIKDKKSISRKIKSIIREFEKEGTNSESHGLILALKAINLEYSVDLIIEEIDCLEFKRLATSIIKKALLDKETLDFMGIPLHLFLVGVIYFNSNFNIEIQSDIFSIYSKFIEQKILIYVEDKQGILHDGRAKKSTIKKETENAYRIHFKLINQLLDDEKLEVDLSEEDLELCASLGIVFISGGEINFLHQTFAEFFIAEFFRLNMKKRVVFKLLFDDKFKVVRTFISSALERKTFENLSLEIFEEVDFLVYVLKEFVHKFYFVLYSFKGPVSCVAKIVRKLLETFEKTVSQDFLNRFFVELERLFLGPHIWWHMIGGCVSVKMLKALFRRNIDRRVLLGMVRHSDPDEVIDVLSECVSMDAAVENERGAEEGGIEEKEKKNALLKLFEIEDSIGGLLEHALWNVKAEMFTKILKFARDVLGKDRFIEEIVQRSEYKKRMNVFVTHGGVNRTCAILRKLHSAFGREIETLYDTELKVKVISESIGNSPMWRYVFEEDEFEEVIGLFVGCFGSEDVKKVLLSGSSDGNYIIEKLSLCSNENRAKNLNVIINVLEDQDKVRKFLKSKGGDLRNLLHYAASRNSFRDIFRFCAANLEKDEIKAMLVSTDRHGENVLQSLVWNDEWETIENLNLIKHTVADVDWFKNFLREKDGNLRGLFHFTPLHSILGDLLQFCNAHLEKDELKEMIVSADRSGEDAWSSLPGFVYSERFFRNLGLLKDVLADNKRFNKILKRKDCSGNLFHNSVLNGNFVDVLQFCHGHLEKDEIKQMIVSTAEKGTTVLNLLLDINEIYSLEKLISILNLIKDTVADDDWFKEFLRNEDVYAKLMTKVFVLTDGTPRDNFGDFLQFCDANLEKDEVQEMFTNADKYGRSSLHLLLENYYFGTLVQSLGAVKDALDNCDWFRRFLMSTDGDLRNAFHIAVLRSDFGDYLQFYGANLEKSDLEKLLISADGNGEDALHLLFAFGSTESVSRSLSLLKDILSDDKWFKEFLKRKDEYRRNIFHSVAENWNKIDFSFLSLYLDERDMIDLLVQRALPGRIFLHFVAESQPRNLPFWLDYSFGILRCQGSRFEEFLLATDRDGNGFLHLLYKSFPPYVFRVRNFDFEVSAKMIIKSLKEKLSEDVYKKLLRIRNDKGQTFMQVESKSKGKIIKSFEDFMEKNLPEELLEPIENVDIDPALMQCAQALFSLKKS